MIQITEENWDKIVHYFTCVCDTKLWVCPGCGMPFEDGYICAHCGRDNSDEEIEGTLEDFDPENLIE